MSEMTEQEAEALLQNFAENKANLHSFFTNVIKTKDTIKTGNLSQEELGMPKLPVRTYKELELFAKEVARQPDWADFFQKMSEIQTSSSLSKDALLLRLSVTSKQEMADVSPRRKNRGWFQKKDKGEQQE